LIAWLRRHPRTAIASGAALAVAAAGLLVFASLSGRPRQIFSFEPRAPEQLPDGVGIAGTATFDRSSYAIGDVLTFTIRVLYRGERVDPELDAFKRTVSVSPFERRGQTERLEPLPGGVTEYVLRYTLQAVNVEPHTTYELTPLVLYYSTGDNPDAELQALRVQPARVHIGGYYPPDVSATPLQALKGEIRDPAGLRRAVMVASGVLLLGLTGLLLWRAARRRRDTELSEPERLWHVFQALDRTASGRREYLVACEQLFTRLLDARARVSPRAFWSGADPHDGMWKDAAARARDIFSRIYQPEAPTDDDTRSATTLLEGLFSSTVAEERLRREQVPSTLGRLRRQPAVLAVSGLFVLLSAAMLVLAARPDLWFPDRMARYNQAVELAEDGGKLVEAAGEFSSIGEDTTDPVVGAAALYNAGTLAASSTLSIPPGPGQEELNSVLFQEHLSLTAMFHELDEGQRLATVEMLSRRAEALTQAEVDLKAAIRIDPGEEDISRNLEVVIKHRQAVLESLKEFLEAQQFEPGEGRKPTDEMSESLVDVLKMMELPAEQVEDAAKDNTGYHVRERF
jgi:hypothetical protein